MIINQENLKKVKYKYLTLFQNLVFSKVVCPGLCSTAISEKAISYKEGTSDRQNSNAKELFILCRQTRTNL